MGVDLDLVSIVSSQLNFTYSISIETVYGTCAEEVNKTWASDEKGDDCVWVGMEGAVNRSESLFGVGHAVMLDLASYKLSSKGSLTVNNYKSM